MICEYPEEFIVTVVYVEDLKDKDIYRCKKSKSLHEGKLLILDEELLESYNEYIIKDSNVDESLEYENIKSIISDIDEDYINSEISSIYNSKY